MSLEPRPAESRPEPGHAPARPPEEDGGSALNPARVSVRLLDSERDIDETLPLALAAHEESRHRECPLDSERRRRFLAERFLADRTRYGFLIAALRRWPSGGVRTLRRMFRADPLQVFVMRYYFGIVAVFAEGLLAVDWRLFLLAGRFRSPGVADRPNGATHVRVNGATFGC